MKYLKAGFTGNSKAGLVVRVGLNLLPLTGTSTPQHLICSLSSHGSVLPRHTLYSGGDKAEVRPRVEQNFGDRSSWTVTPPAWLDLLYDQMTLVACLTSHFTLWEHFAQHLVSIVTAYIT